MQELQELLTTCFNSIALLGGACFFTGLVLHLAHKWQALTPATRQRQLPAAPTAIALLPAAAPSAPAAPAISAQQWAECCTSFYLWEEAYIPAAA